MKKFANKICQVAVAASMLAAPSAIAKITIYMCGDSTMQDWAEGYYPKRGMGQDFSFYFNSDYVTVYNAGRGGTTSQTYYDGHWSADFTKNGVTYPAVSGLVQKGDYVFIMFGANDNGYKTGEVNFKNSIGGMVTESRAKGAIPILLAPIRRSSFTNADSIYESYHAYPIFMRQVADSLNVPLIDLDTLSRNFLLSAGEYYSHYYVNMFSDAGDYSTYANGSADNQHMQQMGANLMGRLVTEQLRVHKDATAKALANYLRPMYQLDVKVSPEGSDSATTLSGYYPQGITITLKTTPKAGKTFLGWYDGSGNKVSSNVVTQIQSDKMISFVMGNKSTQYTAVYSGGTAQKYTGNGAALSTFPTCTPKVLGAGCDVKRESSSNSNANSSSSAFVEEEESSSSIISTDIKSYFDAFSPDSGNGFSENNHEGFIGEGFFNFANEKNSDASYQMVFPSAGYATMAIRYSFVGTSDRTVNVYLDHDYYVTFKSTGSWDTWDTAYVNLDLISGEGQLQFISMTDDGGPNIDAFGFSIAGVKRKFSNDSLALGAGETEVLTNTEAISGNHLQWNLHENANVSIYDNRGRLVANQTLSANDLGSSKLSELVKNNGLYHAVLRQGNLTRQMNFVKVK